MDIKKKYVLIILLILFLIAVFIFMIPTVRESIVFHVERVWIQVYYKINPPEEAVFVPNTPAAEVGSTKLPTYTPIPSATFTPTVEIIADTATPVPTATPLPEAYHIDGVPYIDQHGANNYCAPANLDMMLSYWGWETERSELGNALKPYPEDFNVMPYEMADYVNEQTDLKAILRSGGTPELLKELLLADYPVLLETGRYMVDLSGKRSWMGHYTVVIGYDELNHEFITHDSYYEADYEVSYDAMSAEWRPFNYVFMLIYPPEEENRLFGVLGDYVDEAAADRIAYDIANNEAWTLEGIDQYFAWFNRGTSMVALQDYYGAAETFDRSFEVYDGLSEEIRPYRMLWYQTSPYFAYYNTGRFQDVADLATFTLDNARLKILEESYIWRARAEAALGELGDAQDDLCKALEYHPEFAPALVEIQNLGLSDCP